MDCRFQNNCAFDVLSRRCSIRSVVTSFEKYSTHAVQTQRASLEHDIRRNWPFCCRMSCFCLSALVLVSAPCESYSAPVSACGCAVPSENLTIEALHLVFSHVLTSGDVCPPSWRRRRDAISQICPLSSLGFSSSSSSSSRTITTTTTSSSSSSSRSRREWVFLQSLGQAGS